MTYEPYDPKDRQVTPRTQAVAWLICGLLIGAVMASDALTDGGEAGRQVATAEAIVQDCG